MARGRCGGVREVAALFRARKWTATAASIWIQCTSGSSYCFGIYSSVLKSSQAYDQSTLDSVAFFKDVGANAGLLLGILYSSAADRGGGCGPWVVHAAGAAQCFVGYFFMWLAVTGVLPRPPVLLMCFYMFLAAHALTFFNTANVVTAVQNFPSNRGHRRGHHEVVVIKGQLRDSMPLEASSHERIHLAGDTEAPDRACRGAEAETVHSKCDHVAPSEGDPGPSSLRQSWLPRAEDLNLLQAMGTVDFWLLFLAMACDMGSGLATVNNISQVGGSLGWLYRCTNRYFGFFVEYMELPLPLWCWLCLRFLSPVARLRQAIVRRRYSSTMSVGHAVITSGLPRLTV